MASATGSSGASLSLLCLPFAELSLQQLYAVLQLRCAVFVVEQNCPYLDADGLDAQAYHLLMLDDSTLLAYARIFPPRADNPEIVLGRIVSRNRGKGHGKLLMQAAIERAYTLFGPQTIRLEAQVYAEKFYEKFGFASTGEIYLEDGIPHRRMLLHPQNAPEQNST